MACTCSSRSPAYVSFVPIPMRHHVSPSKEDIVHLLGPCSALTSQTVGDGWA